MCTSFAPDGLKHPAANIWCNFCLLYLFNDNFLTPYFSSSLYTSTPDLWVSIQGSDLLDKIAVSWEEVGAESVDDLISTRTKCVGSTFSLLHQKNGARKTISFLS